MAVSSFERVVDQVREGLKKVYFFNYGDPFVHRSAENMLIHLRQQCPTVEVTTSTNGIPLAKPGRAAAVAKSRIEHVVFTISGMTQASYERYHGRGRLDLALQGMRNLRDATRDARTTTIVWRYLVFNWNDSVEEIESAIRFSEEIGVDQFSLYLTSIPHGAASFRLAPGTPSFDRFRRYIDVAHGYQSQSPARQGFYEEEELPDFGPAQWTSWRASASFGERNGVIWLSFTTLRPAAASGDHALLLKTPWAVYSAPLKLGQWTTVAVPVPDTLHGLGPFGIELLKRNYWFPIEEIGAPDARCLGVLVKSEPLQETSAHLRHADRNSAALFLGRRAKGVAQIESGRFAAFADH